MHFVTYRRLTYSLQSGTLIIMDIKQRIGKRIKDLRKENNNMTQDDLSELTDIDRTYISDVERGKRNIAIVNLEKIAKAFNLELWELLKI